MVLVLQRWIVLLAFLLASVVVAVHVAILLEYPFQVEYGEGSVLLNLPGQSTIDLGHGFRLSIAASGSRDGKIRTTVQWFRGDELVLNTTVGMKSGVPVILGGISHGGGTLIVTLVAE